VALLMVGGSLGDQFGRRRLFVIGLAGFGITSVACAIAPTSEILIAARAAQGLAGALLVPGSLAILAATFEGAERGRMVGAWTAWTGIATVVGPAGGGALIEALSWRAIFWVNVPLVVVTGLLVLHAVAESSDPEADRTVDWAGILLSAAGLGGPVFALIQQPTYGWGDPVVYVPLIVGVALFTAFVIWEARTRHPMLDLSLFRIRNFAVTNMVTLVVYGGLFAAMFYVTLFLQQTVGYTPLEAGLATTPISVMLFVLSPRFGRLASGSGPRLPMSVGPIVGGIGLLMLIGAGADAAYLTEVFPGIVVFALGLAATVAPLTATALDSVEERRVGVASGINNGVSRVAGLLAIAVLGAVIAGSFGSTIDDRLGGAPLSGQGERSVTRVKEKPLGTPDTGGLGGDEAAEIERATAAASEEGFHIGMVLAGALMIVGGVVAAVGIVNPSREEPEAGRRDRKPVGETA
ncbi:MAG: MFS transporter, partial [Solirubrobacterales bacterium]